VHDDKLPALRFKTANFRKWDAFWPFLIQGTNSGPTRLELKQFSMLRRSLPKMVIRVSKGKLA